MHFMLRRIVGNSGMTALAQTRSFTGAGAKDLAKDLAEGFFKGTHLGKGIAMGIFESKDGTTIQEGTFVNGKLVEGVKRTFKHGFVTHEEGYFRNGKLVNRCCTEDPGQ